MLPNDICVNLLNLPHRKDRLESALNQFKEQGIDNYKICEGVIHNLPFTAIAKAYKRIIQSAKDNGDKLCCICEDDIIFSCKDSWKYFIDNIPDYYDIYLSSVYWGDILPDNILKEFSGFTLSIFHEMFYDKFLFTPENNHIDRQMKIHEGVYKVVQPFVAYQQDGFSDNAGKNTNYNEIYLKGVKFYGATLPVH